jgi:hypothetical protein
MRIVLSVHQKIIAYVVVGTILGAIGVLGLNVWLEAGWFHDVCSSALIFLCSNSH